MAIFLYILCIFVWIQNIRESIIKPCYIRKCDMRMDCLLLCIIQTGIKNSLLLDILHGQWSTHIKRTYLYNFDPLKSHFYIVKLGFTVVYIIFLISAQKAQKHRLWVLIRTASVAVLMSTHNPCFEQKYEKNIRTFYLKIFVFGSKMFSIFE